MINYNPEIEDTKYCYPNSFVLKNKLETTDPDDFEEAERQIVLLNYFDTLENPIPGSFDFDHLKRIHKTLFGDIFYWAGETRTVNISKTKFFCPWWNIDSFAFDIFSRLKRDNYLMDISEHQYIEKIALYFADVNALHPFREGNGRTQKVFFEYLAFVSGHLINFDYSSTQEFIDACIMAMDADNRPLEILFSQIIEPITKEEQNVWIQKMKMKVK